MDVERQNCEICFAKPPVYTLAIPCTHNKTFCKSCIQKWLSVGQPNCPKCRAPWPKNIESKCGICRRCPAMSIPLIPCAHRNVFCVECIQRRIAERHLSCPKCYGRWPESIVSPRADQNPMTHMHVPFAARNLADQLFVLSSIVLLATLIIYPTVMK
ncbi:unnamed protein product [Adineta ricciae]|uniref:RING-type domain-containing protein n=1 Tax=Adineta ricciae TaxID=249248 RepID=A0A814HIW7_ADIRI|nr:unnamed protein product [Adineta ricciae]